MLFTAAELETTLGLRPHPSAYMWGLMSEAEAGDHDGVDRALDVVDEAIGGSGVESLRGEGMWDSYYCDIILLYVNRGDPYTPTVYYDTVMGVFGLGCWGDWLEEHEKEVEATWGKEEDQ